jgi:membrane protease YdiL (CAAX protease family)
MILYSAKEFFYVLFGSLILFLAIYLSPLAWYFDLHTFFLMSILSVVAMSRVIRSKVYSSFKCDLKYLNSWPFFLCIIIMFVLYLISDDAGKDNLFTYGVTSFLRATVLSPMVEEIFFRVIFLGYLIAVSKSPIFSFFLVSIFFSLFHNLDMFIYTFILSFVLCFVRFYYKSVLPCVIIHSLHNAAILLIDGVFDNSL